MTRALLLASCLVLGSAVITNIAQGEVTIAGNSLSALPLVVGGWEGQPLSAFDQRVLAALKVDEYLNRLYVGPDGSAIALYIGYYRSQREGDTMHSPLNCLPGAGWQPISSRPLALSEAAVVNRLVIQKGLDTQVVLYWYQSHGRIVASEYWGKAYTVLDAIRLHRTDAAIVRIMAPVPGSGERDEMAVEAACVRFAHGLLPLLARYLPQ